MIRLLLRVTAGVLAATALLFLSDLLLLHLRKQPYDVVTVNHYFAIRQKTGKIELHFDRSYDLPCANSLLPHGEKAPCWYLRRHSEQQTQI